MNTPICDFVKEYSKAQSVRLHMPGHKGKSFLGFENMDITEIEGADVLYSPGGIIEESQNNASSLFGSGKTLFSCEGSSLCIRAMLYLALLSRKNTGGRPVVLAGRNAHKVFLSAAALLDFDVEWLYPEEPEGLISCSVSAAKLDEKLRAMERKPMAVYITSPDYLGNIADIKGLSKVCEMNGVLLLVDNAHGAYLKFLPESRHPLELGADMCCDSAHKTLPVLTGGAYLHISRKAPRLLAENAARALALFASTSPSYLILQSLDRANRYLADGYKDRLTVCTEGVLSLKRRLLERGFSLMGDEPLKLTVLPKAYGYTGQELAGYLNSKNIVCEFSDSDNIVFMFSPETLPEEMKRFENAMLSLERRAPLTERPPVIGVSEKVMTVRRAMFSKSRRLPVEQSLGRTLAAENVSCPPAIPILVCGEKIDERAIEAFRYYNVPECIVVDEVND